MHPTFVGDVDVAAATMADVHRMLRIPRYEALPLTLLYLTSAVAVRGGDLVVAEEAAAVVPHDLLTGTMILG
jgi:hypothetical protein